MVKERLRKEGKGRKRKINLRSPRNTTSIGKAREPLIYGTRADFGSSSRGTPSEGRWRSERRRFRWPRIIDLSVGEERRKIENPGASRRWKEKYIGSMSPRGAREKTRRSQRKVGRREKGKSTGREVGTPEGSIFGTGRKNKDQGKNPASTSPRMAQREETKGNRKPRANLARKIGRGRLLRPRRCPGNPGREKETSTREGTGKKE